MDKDVAAKLLAETLEKFPVGCRVTLPWAFETTRGAVVEVRPRYFDAELVCDTRYGRFTFWSQEARRDDA
jgi:hypothetical protein